MLGGKQFEPLTAEELVPGLTKFKTKKFPGVFFYQLLDNIFNNKFHYPGDWWDYFLGIMFDATLGKPVYVSTGHPVPDSLNLPYVDPAAVAGPCYTGRPGDALLKGGIGCNNRAFLCEIKLY